MGIAAPTFADRTSPPNRESAEAEEMSPGRRELLENILKKSLLPAPAPLAMQIVDKASDPNCEIKEISNLLACDPSLCAKLLKVANSVMYAPAKPVTSIRAAVMALGFKRLRSLVLGMSIPAMQTSGIQAAGLVGFWRSSVAGAILTRELAHRLGYPSPEDDMVSALLRDLGILLLQQTFSEVYAPLWSGSLKLSSRRRCEWEDEQFAVTHPEVGAALLRSWGLPKPIVDPVRFHHAPESIPNPSPGLVQRATLLEFTSRLVELDEIHHSTDDLREIWQVAKETFSLPEEALGEFLIEVTPKVEEFASILQLNIGASPRFAEVLAAGYQELLRLSVTVVDETIAPESSPRPPSPKSSATHAKMTEATADTANDRSPIAPKTEVSFAKRSGTQEPNSVPLPSHPAEIAKYHNYDVVRQIGRGAMGTVYLARDANTGRSVAIKTLSRNSLDCAMSRQRFFREARSAAHVKHENVVDVFATGEEQGVPFLVMEYVAGKSIQEYLDQGRKFTFEIIARIGREIALGLKAAHDLKIIHRDIKPANILLENGTDRVRITDFGLARPVESQSLTQAGTIVGTPQFMSPEQVRDDTLGPPTDMFSLGTVLYVMCTGRLPFDGRSAFETMDQVEKAVAVPIREINPAVPSFLAESIANLHQRDPKSRLTAELLAQRLLARSESEKTATFPR